MVSASSQIIWVDGELIPWNKAHDHMLAHTLHYGLGVFEGIRVYSQKDGTPTIFRLKEHIERLFSSAQICGIQIPYTQDKIHDACFCVVRTNNISEAYLRPLVYLGEGTLGLGSTDAPTRTVIAALDWGAYLGTDGLKNGIRTKVSCFRRPKVDSFLSKAKVCGQYVTSVLAKRDAIQSGYDEAILLDDEGLVAEGSGENIFLVQDGVIYTPPTTSSILPGITRDAVIQIARNAGYKLIEESFTRDAMWIADELFFTGTAAEITPIREVDNHVINTGAPGPITAALQKTFFSIVHGENKNYANWCNPVQ